MANDSVPPPQTPDTPTVSFSYIKNNLFRVIHADGVIGAITPGQHIHFALFSERPAIPQRIEQVLNPGGSPGQEVLRQGRAGYIREMDVDVIVDLKTAKSIHQWLSERIAELESTLTTHAPTSKGKPNA